MFVIKAGLAFTKFQVINFLSLPAVNASLPVGCTARQVIPEKIHIYLAAVNASLPVGLTAKQVIPVKIHI